MHIMYANFFSIFTFDIIQTIEKRIKRISSEMYIHQGMIFFFFLGVFQDFSSMEYMEYLHIYKNVNLFYLCLGMCGACVQQQCINMITIHVCYTKQMEYYYFFMQSTHVQSITWYSSMHIGNADKGIQQPVYIYFR